jgi:hypothetical protein
MSDVFVLGAWYVRLVGQKLLVGRWCRRRHSRRLKVRTRHTTLDSPRWP